MITVISRTLPRKASKLYHASFFGSIVNFDLKENVYGKDY